MELERSELSGIKATETVEARVVLQRDSSLLANEVLEWPFRLKVPQGLFPSMIAGGGTTWVMWRVKGTVACKTGRNFAVDQAVQVYTG